MDYTKKQWRNRVSDHPSRRRLTDLEGNESVYDIARDEGTVIDEGDAFSAANMNDFEDRVETSFAQAVGVRMYIPELTISGTPVQDTEPQSWDTESEYMYHIDVSTPGTIEETDQLTNFVCDTSFEDIWSGRWNVMDDKIRFYVSEATAINIKFYNVTISYITMGE